MSHLVLSILKAYYQSVTDLQTYLINILEPQYADSLLNDSDSETYRKLLTMSYVALQGPSPCEQRPEQRMKAISPFMYMREIIGRVQEKLLRSRSDNVITLGYRIASANNNQGRGDRAGIANFYVNTMVTALQAPEWEELFQRIGTDAMFHILSNTSIFISLPNNCLCQMTGAPIVHFPAPRLSFMHGLHNDKDASQAEKRKSPGSHKDERPRKRLRSKNSAQPLISAPEKLGNIRRVTPADITFDRSKLFYARPALIPHKNHIVVGLSPKHILNLLRPSYARRVPIPPENHVDPDPRKEAEDARHLSKYIFPRQYGGLSNPFSAKVSRNGKVLSPSDLPDREKELKTKGPCKTPKRLKETLPILVKMLWMHEKCAYKPLRDLSCPSKFKTSGSEKLDSSVILELMSDEPSQLKTQMSLANVSSISTDSTRHSVDLRGLSQAEKLTNNKPRFAEFMCSHAEVFRYAVLVTKAVIPNILWGTKKNFRCVMRYVQKFIQCRRYETLTLHYVLQGFSTSECDWLIPSNASAKRQKRVSVTDSLKRCELLEDFMYWYFNSFLLSLLRTTFYVTESGAFKNHVLYFRHDDWNVLCAPLIDRLTTTTFRQISNSEAEEILRQRKLGFSFVRLLPKDSGVRPIVNLRRKPSQKNVFAAPTQSINQILQSAFQILTYEKDVQSQLLGVSVFGTNEVYFKLKAFKSRLLQGSTSCSLPQLYFVKVDVQACFDSIEQTKLLEILRDLISEDAYLIQRYGQVLVASGKIRRKYTRKAIPEGDQPHFLDYASQLASALRNIIFVDQVFYPHAKKQEILGLFEEHINENIVKIGQEYYRQMVGIPQGSVLSSLLCSFFYGDLEKKFSRYTEDLNSTLMRWIDDYLFITTDLSKAQGFLQMMLHGHPDYGCFISKEKSMTNFDASLDFLNVTEPSQLCFPWCGYLINMTDLSVSVDYSRYIDCAMINSLTVDRGRKSGLSFVQKMLKIAKLRSHIIYFDAELNSERVVYRNIYQSYIILAMKMHSYLSSWGPNTSKSHTFIHNTVRQLISHTYACVRNKSVNDLARKNKARCHVKRVPTIWLGTHAFHAVLSRKPTKYMSLIKALAFELSLPRYQRSRKTFRSLIKEAQADMATIPF